jgi:undecaprenyl diphosphate synthase
MLTPKHVAFIMDGNGRWAQQRGLPRSAGHKKGFEHIPEVLQVCYDLGVQVVSGYAWSTENWRRPQTEVSYILHSLEEHLPRFAAELYARQVRFVHSGSRDHLTAKAIQVIDDAVNLTQNNGPWVFNLAFNYGGRLELVNVVRKLITQHVQPEMVSEDIISQSLWAASLPDVDLMIRTGGDQRASNFLLWQSARACLFVTKSYWPEITLADIEQGIQCYQQAMANAIYA